MPFLSVYIDSTESVLDQVTALLSAVKACIKATPDAVVNIGFSSTLAESGQFLKTLNHKACASLKGNAELVVIMGLRKALLQKDNVELAAQVTLYGFPVRMMRGGGFSRSWVCGPEPVLNLKHCQTALAAAKDVLQDGQYLVVMRDMALDSAYMIGAGSVALGDTWRRVYETGCVARRQSDAVKIADGFRRFAELYPADVHVPYAKGWSMGAVAVDDGGDARGRLLPK
ncbi:MAG: hypothetical protein P1U40_14505 [Coxiellaceae bacterium]|nr:hypothetical protein [Coxiellaceae bacterium]